MEKIHHLQTLAQDYEPSRKVLLLVEPQTGQKLVDWAHKNLINRSDTVILLNSRPKQDNFINGIPFVEIAGYDHDLYKRMAAVHRDQVIHFMKLIAKPLVDADIKVDLYCGVGGKGELLEYAEELNADIMAVGSRSGLKLLGSTSNYVVRNSKTPVLVFKS